LACASTKGTQAEMPRLAGQSTYGIAKPLAFSSSAGPEPRTKLVHHAFVGLATEPLESGSPSRAAQRSGLGACSAPRVTLITPSDVGSTRE
jgi:hypothetical protein